MKKILPLLFLMVASCAATAPVAASPGYFDNSEYICTEVRYDSRYGEYCSVYERRVQPVVHVVNRVPVYVHRQVTPTYIHQYRPGVSVNITSRYWNVQYNEPNIHRPVPRPHPRPHNRNHRGH